MEKSNKELAAESTDVNVHIYQQLITMTYSIGMPHIL